MAAILSVKNRRCNAVQLVRRKAYVFVRKYA
jgi:hypothetical protein